MNKSSFNLESTRPSRSSSRPPGRLMLALTARHIRSGSGASFSPTSRFNRLFAPTLLDRLQPTLTRYHD